MDRATAIRKLQACLRLAKSANANEAAAAMRQAQKLMAQYGLDVDDVDLADNGAVLRHGRFDLPAHLGWLANTIAAAFRTTVLLDRAATGKVMVRFVGGRSASEVAAYAFTVLRRQLERDAAKHTSRVRKRANKEARTVEFGLGWVQAIRIKLPLHELSAEERLRFDAFIAKSHGEVQTKGPRALAKRGHHADAASGFIAGSRAELHAGVTGSADPLFLEGPEA